MLLTNSGCVGGLSREWMSTVVRRLCHAEPDGELIRAKGGNSVWRVSVDSQTSAVIKIRRRTGWRAGIRWLARQSQGHREYVILARLCQEKITPTPFGYWRAPAWNGVSVEALFLEDLGRCITGTEHIKRLLADGAIEDLRRFEDRVIELTKLVVEAGITDDDHSFLNFVIAPSGAVVRLDFELARRVNIARMGSRAHGRMYGRMYGRLIGTYTFAVQPRVELARSFAQRLAERLDLSQSILSATNQVVLRMLDVQRRTAGIDTCLELTW